MKHPIFCVFLLMALCQCSTKPTDNTLFTAMPAGHTNIDFANTLPEDNEFNIIQYLYYYNGGGVAIGDVNNDSLPDVFFTGNRTSNQLYINKGDFKFENITQSAGLSTQNMWSTGASMIDINADGYIDIYVCVASGYKQLQGKNKLYINQKNGTFIDEANKYNLDIQALSTQAAWLDYDLDGDLDMYLATHSVHDVDSYGDTTLRRKPNPLGGNKLMQNDNGRFIDASKKAGIMNTKIAYGLAVSVSDLNSDGYPDLYVSNDFYENDYLYYNNKNGGFILDTESSTVLTSNFTMGNDIADFNNDLRPDILSMDMKPEDEPTLKRSADGDTYDICIYKRKAGYHHQYPHNALQMNRGNGKFSEIAHLAGIEATDWSWAALMADLDLDGYKDIYITNGIVRRPNDLDYLKFLSNDVAKLDDKAIIERMPAGETENYSFRNKGDLTFENTSKTWGLNLKGYSNGTATADLDNDGDLDIITNNINNTASIYKNNSAQKGNNYIKISLKSPAPNVGAVGSKVVVWAQGKAQMQEVYMVRGFLSSVDCRLSFGLGKAKKADSVQVFWANGNATTLKNVATNCTLYLDNTQKSIQKPTEKASEKPLLMVENLTYKHTEDKYSDITRERLMPWLLSTQNPRIALHNAPNGTLMYITQSVAGQTDAATTAQTINIPNVKLVRPQPQNPDREDADAVFIDANGDTRPDLLVASGGNQTTIDNLMRPRLYINQKNGDFIEKTDAFTPEIFTNASCIITKGQYVFVGGRSVVGSYGINPRSFLLRNNGEGKYMDITPKNLQNIGMITDAEFVNINQNPMPDLVLVGEFMPITIVYDCTTITPIKNTDGFYNCLTIKDINNDTRPDILAGNIGNNTNMRANATQPIEIHTKDYDKNGSTEPIISYYRQDTKYMFASKDELISQMPGKRKKFVEYAKYAQSTFTDVFDADELTDAVYKKVVQTSSLVLMNKGTSFDIKPLPTEAQFAPVFAIFSYDFDNDGNLDLLLGGNFYDVVPKIGRLGGSYGTVLMGNGKGDFVANNTIIPQIKGAMRDIKPLPNGNILIARNNNYVQLLRFNP